MTNNYDDERYEQYRQDRIDEMVGKVEYERSEAGMRDREILLDKLNDFMNGLSEIGVDDPLYDEIYTAVETVIDKHFGKPKY